MALEFPTLAERALAEFKSAPKTVSLATIAKRMGADVEKKADFNGTRWTYTFDDDTSLTVTGVGKAHRVEAHLP